MGKIARVLVNTGVAVHCGPEAARRYRLNVKLPEDEPAFAPESVASSCSPVAEPGTVIDAPRVELPHTWTVESVVGCGGWTVSTSDPQALMVGWLSLSPL